MLELSAGVQSEQSIKSKMPSQDTPGVPTPEESAKAMRKMTEAFPVIPDNGRPRCYDQCVELPGPVSDQVAGEGDAYQE